MRGPKRYSQVISNIYSILTDDVNGCPGDSVGGMDGKSTDLLRDQGGKFSWLTLEYSTDWSKGLTNVYFAHDNERGGHWVDMAKGAGGSFVYMELSWDTNNKNKISEVRIMRSNSKLSLDDVRAKGYTGMSNDFNQGRGHDFVYVIWKTIQT